MLLRPFNLFGFSTTARRLLRRVTIELAFSRSLFVATNLLALKLFHHFFLFLFWCSVEITLIRDIVERAFWQKSKTPSCKTAERRSWTPRSNCASIYVQGVSGFFVQTTRAYSSSKNNQFYTNVDLWKASWSIVDNILVVRLVSIVRKRVRIVIGRHCVEWKINLALFRTFFAEFLPQVLTSLHSYQTSSYFYS